MNYKKIIMFFLTLASVVDVEQSILALTGVIARNISTDTKFSRTAVQIWIQAFIDVFKKNERNKHHSVDILLDLILFFFSYLFTFPVVQL